MRRKIFLILLLLMNVSTYMTAASLTLPDLLVDVIPSPNKDTEVPVKDPVVGNRIPGQRLTVSISTDGTVNIPGVAPEDIITYEILDCQENVIGSFGDGFSFTDTLFSLQGEYVVRFYTEEYVYMGYVWIH